MHPQVGQVVNNKYRLIRLVGDGGMGSVYEARHEVLGTTVALKFLHPELSRRAGLVQRFLQEARVSAHIVSPHVVKVTDVDQTAGGLAFLVMEYVQGSTLQTVYEDLYRQRKRMPYADALEYAMQMLDGVEAAHKAGVVHRDLKPDNVMITKGQKGETLLKLLDFGIAKLKVSGELERGLTRPGVMMGTPEYMAPEQAYSADAVDARADIFSLGVMLFEMLAGRRPVGGDEPHQIASAYLSGLIAKLDELVPGIEPGLSAAVHKAMAPLAVDRFATVSDFRDALEPWAQSVRGPAVAATPRPAKTPAHQATTNDDVAPAIAAVVGEERRAVPKTLPPEDDGTAEAAPGTPLGGFSVGDAALASPAAAAPDGPAPAPIPSPLPATESYTPAPAAVPATNFDAAPPPAARPGGTAVGSAAIELSHPATVGDPGPAAIGAYSPPSAYAPKPRKPASPATSMLTILLLATGASALVVGGVYAASEYSRSRESDETVAIEPPPAVTVPPAPSEPAPTTPPVATDPPFIAPVPVPTTPKPVPTAPKPTPTTTTPKPTPTGIPVPTTTTPKPNPTGIPTTFPPFIIPTSLPPLFGPGATPRPTATSTTPAPTSTTTSSGRPPIVIIRPKTTN